MATIDLELDCLSLSTLSPFFSPIQTSLCPISTLLLSPPFLPPLSPLPPSSRLSHLSLLHLPFLPSPFFLLPSPLLPPSTLTSPLPPQVDKEMDAERSRRIEESKDETSDVNTQRRETYNRLVTVQEDLLKTIQRMKVGRRERWREGERGEERERKGGRNGERMES